MTWECIYIVDIPPVTKKNSQQIVTNRVTGRPFVIQSAAYKRYEEAAGAFLAPRPPKPINEPCNVRYRFYTATRRRVDLANLISAMDDVLVHWKILADDNRDIIAAHDGCRVYCDKDDPRTEILITPIGETYRTWKE